MIIYVPSQNLSNAVVADRSPGREVKATRVDDHPRLSHRSLWVLYLCELAFMSGSGMYILAKPDFWTHAKEDGALFGQKIMMQKAVPVQEIEEVWV
jgi:hypothetical protein